MSRRIYVGNLSDDTTEDDLLYNFGELGECLSATIIRDKHTGKSKGFAFVEMGTEAQAREAIRICKGVGLDNKKLIVSEARPQAGGKPSGKSETASKQKRRRPAR